MVSKLEQDLLLSHVLKKDRTYLYSNTIKLSKKGQKTYNLFLKRRKKGEPLAYILGKKEFYSLELTVNKNVLIPRPETELIVDVVLDLFKGDACSLLDLGTGSGAISFALAKERPSWKILAIDKSKKALNVAKLNAKNLKIENVTLKKSTWCNNIKEKDFDIIVSNPPYIAKKDPHLRGDIRFEPKKALISKKNGLFDIEKIIIQAKNKLKPNGILILEHGFDQSYLIKNIMMKHGYINIKSFKDLMSHDRVISGNITNFT